MTDIVTELRQRHRNTTGLDPRITNPIVGPTIFLEAADEIERLRVIVQGWEHSARNAERDMATLRAERDEASQRVCSIAYPEQHIQELVKTINTLRAERDEARRERDKATRLLHAMVEHIYETTPLDKNPKHDCGFDHRPDLGSCKFCENWTAANVILYGEEYANEDTNV